MMRLAEGEGWKHRADGAANLDVEALAAPTPSVSDLEKIMSVKGR
jgi:hypothetical protein